MNSTAIVESTNETLRNLNPDEFAVALFSNFEDQAKKAIAEIPKEGSYDVTTKEGMAIAKEQLKAFKALRIDSDKERKTYKDPILKTGKALDDHYKAFVSSIAEYEKRFADEIKQEKERLEAIEAEKMRVIAEREATIEDNFARLRNAPVDATTLPFETVLELQTALEAMEVTEADFGDRMVEAELLLKDTLPKLATVIAGRQAQEEMMKRAEADRQESERKAAIDARIADINSFLTTAVSARTSSELATLIKSLEDKELVAADFGDRLHEAETTKSNVLDVMAKQFQLVKQAELQQAELAKAPVEEPVAPKASEPSFRPKLDDEVPTREDLIMVLSDFYAQDPETIESWLVAHFGVKAA